ncbi:MAG: DUF1570 domain-containing protein [Planctomycetota bacterium]|nr:MAG: DUF1570 domain-containing protein [Planctomycetota bacterium]REK27366.1 MAG: DUF1570 domain-containing protein [Planctomycetota bacterium]REK36612.1 MAG: DUF1570 domain-containing protein [Planctomycetota bacterium]
MLGSRPHAASMILTVLIATDLHAGGSLIEMKTTQKTYIGRSLAHNSQQCLFQERDGGLVEIALPEVTEYRRVAPVFRSRTVAEVRDSLAREMGRDFEVTAAGRYVVAAAPGKAEPLAQLLDRVQRSFQTFFSRRNLGLSQPEFPLTAVVYPDERAFAEHCRDDGMQYSPTLQGYYNPVTNRIALYDPGESLVQFESNASPGRLDLETLLTPRTRERDWQLQPVSARATAIDGDLRDTIVHEATHQLAFNMGLHTRIGSNPHWVVEGIALLFERNLDGKTGGALKSRINEERFTRFVQRGPDGITPLREFLASDRSFSTNPLDAYAQSWSLAFYLSERRSADFAKYLRTIRDRDPLQDYTGEQRLEDFRKCFGDDVDWIEVQWLRFMDDLS